MGRDRMMKVLAVAVLCVVVAAAFETDEAVSPLDDNTVLIQAPDTAAAQEASNAAETANEKANEAQQSANQAQQMVSQASEAAAQNKKAEETAKAGAAQAQQQEQLLENEAKNAEQT